MAFSLLQHSPHAHAYGHGHEGLSSGTIPNLRYGSLQPTRRTVLPLYSRLNPLHQGLLRLPPPASSSSSSSSSSLPSAPAEPGVTAAASNLADGIAPPQPSQLSALMASVVGCESDALISVGEETMFSLLPSPSPSPSPLLLAESMASAVQLEKKVAEAEALDSSVSRRQKRDLQRSSYLFAAIASSTGVTSLSVAAVYYRFTWQMQGGTVPVTEMFGTFALAFGAAVGMEYWARWAHKELWHNSLWSMHESHHRPREGPFELNDIFAIINAVPAIALIAYGFFHKGLVPGLCFGAGLGITVFGMAYMFVHDGLIHRRFPVGPIADVPFFQRVAVAHQLHHADKYQGVPFGIFLGPQELENVGGSEELEKLLEMRKKGIQATKEKSES